MKYILTAQSASSDETINSLGRTVSVDYKIKDLFKKLMGKVKWHKESKLWSFEDTKENEERFSAFVEASIDISRKYRTTYEEKKLTNKNAPATRSRAERMRNMLTVYDVKIAEHKKEEVLKLFEGEFLENGLYRTKQNVREYIEQLNEGTDEMIINELSDFVDNYLAE